MRALKISLLVFILPISVSAQWVQTSLDSLQVRSFSVSGTNLFAGTYFNGVFLSTNRGANWTAVNNGLTCLDIYDLIASGSNIFAGTECDGVFLSTNNGTSWTAVNNGLTSTSFYCFAISDINLYTGTYGGGLVFLSTNNGTSWTAVGTGITANQVSSLAISGTNLFAGTDGGVFLSTDDGTSWTAVNNGLPAPGNFGGIDLTVIGINLFAGLYPQGVFLSTDDGTSWTAVNNGLTNTVIMDLAVSDTNLFAGTFGGVFLSTNYGTSWIAVNEGLGANTVYTLAVCDSNLFAGTLWYGVMRRPLTEMFTMVEGSTADLSTSFALSQNYPNPFNPTTSMQYTISSRQFVTLKVYDLLGREVATLVSEEKSAGEYEVEFSGSALPSGIYFYQLKAGQYSETRKMVLLK